MRIKFNFNRKRQAKLLKAPAFIAPYFFCIRGLNVLATYREDTKGLLCLSMNFLSTYIHFQDCPPKEECIQVLCIKSLKQLAI